MAKLFHFIDTENLPVQNEQGNLSFGFIRNHDKSINANKFRITSSFEVPANIKAYAMLRGTILLQPQGALDSGKVNLIIKPIEQADIKLPVKYIIYRGLNTTDFLTNVDISAAGNQVKTTGSELLDEMQHIQQGRAPGEAIPVSALFGDVVAAGDLITTTLDEFFYKKQNLPSQLFTIPNERNGTDLGGIELGNFVAGEPGIDIILENPEYEPNVAMARLSAYEIEITDATDIAKTRWEKEQVRHFVDPAAFYGLHHDIDEWIEYRVNGTRTLANTPELIYEHILGYFSFIRKNQFYLDIRSENGYSYNYYQNYNVAVDDDRGLRIAEGNDELIFTSYYTEGWPVYIVEVANPSNTDNENYIKLSFSTNNNERPLLIGWNTKLVEARIIDPPLSSNVDNKAYFVDNYFLYPGIDIPDFTNEVTVRVPNLVNSADGTGRQIPTIARLDYIKQLQLDDTANLFPQTYPTDYLFGPITTKIPWDSENGIQWIGTKHYKYYDGLNHGVVRFGLSQTVTAASLVILRDSRGRETGRNTEITIQGILPDEVLDNSFSITGRVPAQSILAVRADIPNNNTIVTIDGDFVAGITSAITSDGPKFLIYLDFMAKVDYRNNRFIIEGKDLTNPMFNIFRFQHHFKLDTGFTFPNVRAGVPLSSYTVDHIQLDQGNTLITPHEDINNEGVAAVMQTGIVSETDTATNNIDNDNVLLYALPKYYYEKTGNLDTNFLNVQGGTSSTIDFFSAIRKIIPTFYVYKSSFEQPANQINNLLIHSTDSKVKENIWVLALKKSEWINLMQQTEVPISSRNFSNYHLKMCRLLLQAPLSRSIDYKPYYHYKLVIAGLDTEGRFIETDPTQGIDIYSKDGFVFSSNDYASGLSQTGVDFKVHFRRPNGSQYKKHFGFDWMREEYIKETSPTTGGICFSPSPNTAIGKDEAQNRLKQEYTPININGEDYYVPWLSMFKNHADFIRGGDTFKFREHSVILRLQIEKNRGATVRTQVIRFETPDGIEADCSRVNDSSLPTNEIHAKDAHNALIEIKCTKKDPQDRKVYAYDQSSTPPRLVGALNIFKNQATYKMPVRFVRVTLQGTLTFRESTGANIIIDYTNNATILRNMRNQISTWEGIIDRAEEDVRNTYAQSLIKYEPIKRLDASSQMVIDYRDITVNLGNYIINTPANPVSNAPIDRIRYTLNEVNGQGAIELRGGDTFSKIFIDSLYELYVATFPDPDETLTAFVFPIPVSRIGLEVGETVSGSANGNTADAYAFLFRNSLNWKNNTIIHESAHTLGLVHPSQISAPYAQHSFKEFFTENIMDYTNGTTPSGKETKISFWKWQWEKLHQDDDLHPE